jgi:hypothetical protein
MSESGELTYVDRSEYRRAYWLEDLAENLAAMVPELGYNSSLQVCCGLMLRSWAFTRAKSECWSLRCYLINNKWTRFIGRSNVSLGFAIVIKNAQNQSPDLTVNQDLWPLVRSPRFLKK